MGNTGGRVAITGASGYIGAGLVRELCREDDIEMVLATDIVPPRSPLPAKAVFVHQDVTDPFGELFSEYRIDTVVHLAYVMRPDRDRESARRVNVGGTKRVLAACSESGVSRLVYLSSTSVYGAHSDNPALLSEDSPTRPAPGFQYSVDKMEAEALIREFAKSAGSNALILRCCPVIGPRADNFIARAFLKPVLVAVRGSDPPMQFIHEDDLVSCLVRCTVDIVPGVFNVAGEGAIRWSEMAAALGRRLVALPAPVLYTATQIAWALHLQSDSPASGLDFIRYPWNVDTSKIETELAYQTRYTSRQAWETYAEGRRKLKQGAAVG
jgi:UDP-glucose 4-epimerase